MEPTKIIRCQWKPCENAASRHVAFGFRTFGSREYPADEPYTVLHRSVCPSHLEKARLEYLDVTEFDIGSCPACDRGRKGSAF